MVKKRIRNSSTKKLVLELSDEKSAPLTFPQQYNLYKQLWLGEIISEDGDGLVEEFELLPNQKLMLDEFLSIVTEKLSEVIDNNSERWGIKIFRVT